MLADEVDFVVGVDTHRDEHVLAVVACSRRAACSLRRAVRTNGRGYAEALRFADELGGRAPGSGRSKVSAITALGLSAI